MEFILKTAIFLQARLDSTRLNNKIVRNLGEKSLIEQIVDRLRCAICPMIQKIVIVTSYSSYPTLENIFKDDAGVDLFAGSEENVLERYYKANQYYEQDYIIRSTADNPFVSIEHIHSILVHHIKNEGDLSHYMGLPLGTGVEVISATALEKAYQSATTNYQKEHVTPYLYQNSNHFTILEPDVEVPYNRPEMRLTIDEEADLRVAEKIFKRLYKGKNCFPLYDIIKVVDKENLSIINKNVHQKTLVH